jgi:hypothetical protein
VEPFHPLFSTFLLGPHIVSKPIVGAERDPEYSDVSALIVPAVPVTEETDLSGSQNPENDTIHQHKADTLVVAYRIALPRSFRAM